MHALFHGWVDIDRTTQANARLGGMLSFVAGAANAGGFLAVGQYTSHMTGVVSSIADNLVLGNLVLALTGVSMIVAFLMGAITTTLIVRWGLHHQLRSSYGLPLLLEAGALVIFGLFGAAIQVHALLFAPLTVALLCFIMGLQNAMITKISKSEIRTTHVTGLVTDLGIEIGKRIDGWREQGDAHVFAPRHGKMRILFLLAACFFIGGVVGALGFKHLGYISSIPLAIGLVAMVYKPIASDAYLIGKALRQR